MLLSLPWAHPLLGHGESLEVGAAAAILLSTVISCLIGVALYRWGRPAHGTLFRKEALAVVGLSWLLACLLGALPFILSGTQVGPGQRMLPHDALFESVSGFTGTGATVVNDLEDPRLVPRSILFWRSETHFLGGLGILVLFVALLGQGSAGKALMRAEMPGPNKDVPHARMQHAAWIFAGIYLGLNALLTLLLMLEGMTLFDAVCHSFATVATGGFSTYNASVGHFDSVPIEMTLTVFMFVACINFTLLYYVLLLQPQKLFRDVEFRVYSAILLAAVFSIIGFGLLARDFDNAWEAFRYTVFDVTSVMTNTGFITRDFDTWSEFARGTLFLLMFVGGCAGSTSCSIKVIRHILLWKILRLEVERAYHPSVVRPLRLQGEVVDDPQLAKHVLVYFGLVAFIFVLGWVALLGLEPDARWAADGSSGHNKFMDCASGVATTINGVGPGLGAFGSTENFSSFTVGSKFVFVALMVLGRLEVIPVVVLFLPAFWKAR
ncbi:MAG: TrkH family potassium uptake protein [Planctomycetia bacterium]|nr:TrkH family potassium uptake protein [Planctomycetia bacterium]